MTARMIVARALWWLVKPAHQAEQKAAWAPIFDAIAETTAVLNNSDQQKRECEGRFTTAMRTRLDQYRQTQAAAEALLRREGSP